MNHSFLTRFALCFGLITGFVLGACSALPRPASSRDVVRRDLVYTQPFDVVTGWDTYESPAVSVLGEDGGLVARVDGGQYVYSLSDQRGADMSVDIDAQFLDGDEQGGFGLICRADPAVVGSGYYFLISADGSYTIRRGQGREVVPLVAWARSASIRTGGQVNTVRAVCVEDYLALYVNGAFVAEVRDAFYESGYIGVALVGRRDQTLDVRFDNVYLWTAE